MFKFLLFYKLHKKTHTQKTPQKNRKIFTSLFVSINHLSLFFVLGFGTCGLRFDSSACQPEGFITSIRVGIIEVI